MSKLLINENPLQVLPSLAIKYGLNEAIVIQQLHYWLNRSTNVEEGRKWVYNSIAKWHEQFPFWSEKTISRILKKLCDVHLVIKGNFNKMPMDKTLWYTLDYGQLDITIQTTCLNEVDKVTKAIPETTTETTTKKKDIEKDFNIFWSDYPRKVGKGKARSSYEKARKKASHDEIMRGVFISPRLKGNDPQYLPHAATWLNQESWTDEEEADPNAFPFPHLELRELTTGDKVYIDKAKALVYEESGAISSVWYFDKADQAVDMK